MKSTRYILTLLAFIMVATPSYRTMSSMILTDVRINITGTATPEKYKQIIPFYQGQEMEESVFEESILKLSNLNLFKNITYKLTPISKSQFKLELNLERERTIRGLSVSGNYPILSKNITKLIPLQSGSIYNEELIPKSIEAIQDYLDKLGYYNSEIEITSKPHKKYNTVDLEIKINKGKRYRIHDIKISGNSVFSSSTIRSKMVHLSRFSMKRFKSDLKKIKKMYAAKGYIKTRVKLKSLKLNSENHTVDLEIFIKENKKLKIEITGDTFIPKSKLKNITGLEERRSYDRFAIKNGKRRLERYYKKAGFPDAKVKSEVIKPSKNNIIAKYTIQHGKRVELKKIRFVGNSEIKDKKLKKELLNQETGFLSQSFFFDDFLLLDQKKLQETYQKRGFFDAIVEPPSIERNDFGDQKTIVYPIHEGPKYLIRKIEFQSDLPVDTSELLSKAKIKTGKDYNFENISKATGKMTEILKHHGFAYAAVEQESVLDEGAKTVLLNIKIHRGPKVVIRSVMIEGNHLTKASTIERNMKIFPGDIFDYQNMVDAQLNLRKIGTFSSVRITPMGIENKSEEIDLLVSVIERKTLVTNIQAGFDSRHLATGEVNLTKYNLFGAAKHFNTRLIGGPKYNRGEVTLSSPRIFGASWNLSNQYFVEYEDEPNFVDINYGGFINALKNFGPCWTFGFKEQITHTEVFENKSNIAILGDSLFDNTFNEFQLILMYDKRDNFSDPQKGYYILVRNELNTDLSNARNNFDTLQVSVSHHQSFLKRFTLNNTLRYGHTFDITSNPRIPVNKLFFLGGADTIRGFSEDGVNASGGTVLFVYNAELHLRLHESIKLAGFFDSGFLSNDINTVTLDDMRESAGIGLRYFTPIGPIRLDYGFILDRREGEPRSRFHFSFGYFF